MGGFATCIKISRGYSCTVRSVVVYSVYEYYGDEIYGVVSFSVVMNIILPVFGQARDWYSEMASIRTRAVIQDKSSPFGAVKMPYPRSCGCFFVFARFRVCLAASGSIRDVPPHVREMVHTRIAYAVPRGNQPAAAVELLPTHHEGG